MADQPLRHPPVKAVQPDNPLKGIALLVAAFACFSCSDAASKLMTGSMPAIEIAWLRYVVFLALMMGAVALSGAGAKAFRSKRPALQFVRACGVLGSTILFIMGLRYLPMAEATAITFIAPVYVTALSILLLGEFVGIRRWAAVFIGLLGVLIVVRPGTGAFDAAAFFPLTSSLCWAVALIVTRKMSSADGPLVALTYAALVGFAFTSVLVPFEWTTPGWREIGLGIVTGAASTAAQWLTVLAFQHARASVLAPFSYSQLIWSTLLGFAVFGNLPDSWTLVGAVIIIASGLYTAHRERVRARLPS
ncbi:DMT family transporter [Microvirga pudoricolor]|uniref:DMT family transporter n=1 Tax=Microvirga pudoricolor TaxID=2778729 RepID=UPI00194E0ADA|nr:DMT family transporter [Microvirga pudoricolor]MBM6592588.1 DMT family transporter [Microvirga pudoricolor]